MATSRSAKKVAARKSDARRRPALRRSKPAASADAKAEESGLLSVARQVRGWTGSVLEIAGAAADVSIGVAKSMLPKPEQREALAKAGDALRRMREAAGLSLEELGRATDLDDPALLELAEHGKIAVPFEILLRLASVLGRNDPVAFLMKITRTSNPEIWETLEKLGVGRLVVQAGREREFVNIFRAHDSARRLSDREFAHVVEFTRAAFELALAFHDQSDDAKPRPVGKRGVAKAAGRSRRGA